MEKFVITNGDQFIGLAPNNCMIKVENIYDARVFSSSDKCKNIINHNLVKEKDCWYYIKLEDDDRENCNYEKAMDERISIQLNKPIKRTVIDDYIDRLKEITDEIDLNYFTLKRDLERVEKEIVDIYHAMEFYDLSASKGYKIYKMMQERLQHRREIKDELEKIKIMLGIHIEKKSVNKAKEKIEGMEQRRYVPRVMIELFN